jgi:putative ABC transport system permease protein
MMLGETFRVAAESLAANRLRSLLTVLGVVIGIAAVIAMMALGEGAQRSVRDRLASLGTNILTVRPGQAFFGGGGGRQQARMTVEDAEALRDNSTSIARISPELESRLQVEAGSSNANLSVVGTWATYFEVNNFIVASGRVFTDAEERGRRRVAVVGALVGNQLRVGTSLLGQEIRIAGVTFEVIGVLQEKGAQGFFNPDEGVYIPLATAQFRVMGTDRIRSISVQAESEAGMEQAMVETDQILRRAHRLKPGEEPDFNIRDQASLLVTMQETARTFSILLAGIAAISLIVGGIGIMNIMLVSVTERTREIGLRKALGARKSDILLQFLIESVVLCLLGGFLGLLLGMGCAYAFQRIAGWNTQVAPEAIVMAILFSAAVGIFFGLWPARRAAALSPIEALRYE